MQNMQLVKSAITAPYIKLKVQLLQAAALYSVQSKWQQKAGALLTLRKLNASFGFEYV